MKKKNIIRKTEEFSKIINSHHRQNSKYFNIYYQLKLENENRYGISIPKKTSNAVNRNKIKRRIKSIIDNNIENKNQYDYVIIAKKEILNADYQEIEINLVKMINKIEGEEQ